MKLKTIACLAALSAIAATNVVVTEFELPKIKLTVKVLDEAGSPFPNADVQFSFQDPATRKGVLVQGKTDMKGLFIGEGHSEGTIGGSVQKDGYYRSGFPFKVTGLEDGRWQPWNPTAVTILRPIGKPVTLYAKSVWIEIPVIGKPCGYDLEAGDWVTPYGKGMIADLIFNLERRYVSRDDFDVSVKLIFKNPLDGIQEVQWPEVGQYSTFKWPREAPETGYDSTLKSSLTSDSGGYHASASEKQGYFFRVRTVEQNGIIVSAHYGKIRGGFELAPSNSKTCKVKLTCYFNPTPNDRNLEWDTKKNLFGGLSNMESPREP
jgi:hypothetical protein